MADDALHRTLALLRSSVSMPESRAALLAAYTCDNGTGPIKVCLDGLRPAQHHFEDLEQRLSIGMGQEVENIMLRSEELQQQGVSKRDADEQVLNKVGKYLMRNWSKVCPRGSRSGHVCDILARCVLVR